MNLKNLFKKKGRKEVIKEGVRISPDSADAQIDGLILSYQQESISEGKLDPYFAKLLGEGPEEENSQAMTNVTGDGAMATDQPAVSGVKQIDLDSFAQKVVTLYQNYQQLLDLEAVIVNRAKNVLRSAGYDENVVVEFEEVLDRDFGVSNEKEDVIPVPEAPPGGAAGPLS